MSTKVMKSRHAIAVTQRKTGPVTPPLSAVATLLDPQPIASAASAAAHAHPHPHAHTHAHGPNHTQHAHTHPHTPGAANPHRTTQHHMMMTSSGAVMSITAAGGPNAHGAAGAAGVVDSAPAGRLYFPNGDRYTGEMGSERVHGYGMYWFAQTNHTYQGQWVDGHMEGRGAYRYSAGERYEGDFRQDTRHGIGAYYHSNGDVYHGSWVNDQRHGKGKIMFGSGPDWSLIGEWKNDRCDGLAVRCQRSGHCIVEHWREGVCIDRTTVPQATIDTLTHHALLDPVVAREQLTLDSQRYTALAHVALTVNHVAHKINSHNRSARAPPLPQSQPAPKIPAAGAAGAAATAGDQPHANATSQSAPAPVVSPSPATDAERERIERIAQLTFAFFDSKMSGAGIGSGFRASDPTATAGAAASSASTAAAAAVEVPNYFWANSNRTVDAPVFGPAIPVAATTAAAATAAVGTVTSIPAVPEPVQIPIAVPTLTSGGALPLPPAVSPFQSAEPFNPQLPGVVDIPVPVAVAVDALSLSTPSSPVITGLSGDSKTESPPKHKRQYVTPKRPSGKRASGGMSGGASPALSPQPSPPISGVSSPAFKPAVVVAVGAGGASPGTAIAAGAVGGGWTTPPLSSVDQKYAPASPTLLSLAAHPNNANGGASPPAPAVLFSVGTTSHHSHSHGHGHGHHHHSAADRKLHFHSAAHKSDHKSDPNISK